MQSPGLCKAKAAYMGFAVRTQYVGERVTLDRVSTPHPDGHASVPGRDRTASIMVKEVFQQK